MYIQLEKEDCELIAEKIFNELHDRGTVYLDFGEEEISVKYEKDVRYSGYYNSDGTQDVTTCDLDILCVEHTYFDVEYNENDIIDSFYDVVHKV